ncbi:MAG TPA: hypothetical protein VJ860_06930 [Polyangia bacterium]|jgi:hypothetical protein|nr:hypothetical protein [Polyangia bacterium]
MADNNEDEEGMLATQYVTPPYPVGPPDYGRGNINLNYRPVVHHPDGSISTLYSSSSNIDGKEVLYPGVSADGRMLTKDQALAEYLKTGQYLGKFNTPAEADAYAEKIHQDGARKYLPMDASGKYVSGGDTGWMQRQKLNNPPLPLPTLMDSLRAALGLDQSLRGQFSRR